MNPKAAQDVEIRDIKTAFGNRIQTKLLTYKFDVVNISQYLHKIWNTLNNLLKDQLNHFPSFKINLILKCKFVKPVDENEFLECDFKTGCGIIFKNEDLYETIHNLFLKIESEFDTLQQKGSGWVLNKIYGLEVSINRYDALKSGIYIPLPYPFVNSRFIINIQNGDNDCFKYCIYTKFLTETNRYNPRYYKHLDRLEQRCKVKFSWNNIDFPTPLNHISKFVAQNPTVSINIFGIEEDKIYPVRITDEEKQNHYDLLYVTNDTTSHYCYITNFNALIRSQLTKHHGQIAVCKRCLAYFQGANKDEKLSLHRKYCNRKTVEQPAQYTFPEEGEQLFFKKHHMSQPVDYVAFADFEVMLVPTNVNPEDNTKNTHKHIPIAFCYYIIGPDNTPFSKPVHYVGVDAASEFIKQISAHAQSIEQLYKSHPDVPLLTPTEYKQYCSARTCCICSEPLSKTDDRVRHHSHVSGKFIGAAHGDCNVNAKVPNFLPVFFHNLSRYDGHITALVIDNTDKDISTIPLTSETYISFSKKVSDQFYLRFVDSLRFLQTSLRNLVDILPIKELTHTKLHYSDPNQFRRAQKKNYFPYEFLDDEKKLTLTSLPPPENFYSSLDNTNISQEEYKFAQEAWIDFKCKTLGDYLEQYCIIDVLLLADCFTSFRKHALSSYKIDPAYSFSLPGFTFDAFLRKSRVKFELLSDPDMYLFFERSIRGGITSTISRYSKADKSSETPNSILYIDANNLYGMAMMEKLPERNFKFEEELSKFTPQFITQLSPDNDVGYFLEVDLHYPINLHDKHNELPLCCEKKKTPGSSSEKLLCTLEDKKNYTLHYRTLQFCLQQGLILEKVHRVVSFHQSAFLKDYINMNTEFRQKSTNDFERSMYKLMNNACFGKFIENQRNRVAFDLCCKQERVDKLIRSPFFKESVIFKETLVGIHRHKREQRLDRPIYVGSTILELARLHMYKFFYEVLPIVFPDVEYHLLYMDTDSFILSIKTPNLIPYIQAHSQYFDCSCYNPSHPLYSAVNAKVPGKFKDELPNCNIDEYISICPKVYAIETDSKNKKPIKKIKGCKRSVIQKEISVADFRKCLLESKTIKKEQRRFGSKYHQLFTISQKKVVLELLDAKRVWLPPNYIHSLAYGHYKQPNTEA